MLQKPLREIYIDQSGFLANDEKSEFEPRQYGEWLGTIIDTKTMKFSIPERKILAVKQKISNFLAKGVSTAKPLSQITGYLSSMLLGPLV